MCSRLYHSSQLSRPSHETSAESWNFFAGGGSEELVQDGAVKAFHMEAELIVALPAFSLDRYVSFFSSFSHAAIFSCSSWRAVTAVNLSTINHLAGEPCNASGNVMIRAYLKKV